MNSKRLVFLIIPLIFVFGLAGSGAGYFIFTLYQLPTIEQLENYQPSQTTIFYSEKGEVLAEFFIEKREVVPLEKIPPHLKNAFIAVEDHRFYSHPGFDIIRLVKALWEGLLTRSTPRGTSTITQQLARNLFLTQERTISRKIKEIILAIEIEKKYSKDEILKMYLNQIYFGHGIYGVAEAASFYFDKPVQELNLAESALLAAIPRSPGIYSPFWNPQEALKRRNYILQRMCDLGFITFDEAKKAQSSPLGVVEEKERKKRKHIYAAPYFVEHVRQLISEKYV